VTVVPVAGADQASPPAVQLDLFDIPAPAPALMWEEGGGT